MTIDGTVRGTVLSEDRVIAGDGRCIDRPTKASDTVRWWSVRSAVGRDEGGPLGSIARERRIVGIVRGIVRDPVGNCLGP